MNESGDWKRSEQVNSFKCQRNRELTLITDQLKSDSGCRTKADQRYTMH